MFSQNWNDIQELQEGLNNLNMDVNRNFERAHQEIDNLQYIFDNL